MYATTESCILSNAASLLGILIQQNASLHSQKNAKRLLHSSSCCHFSNHIQKHSCG